MQRNSEHNLTKCSAWWHDHKRPFRLSRTSSAVRCATTESILSQEISFYLGTSAKTYKINTCILTVNSFTPVMFVYFSLNSFCLGTTQKVFGGRVIYLPDSQFMGIAARGPDVHCIRAIGDKSTMAPVYYCVQRV